MDKRSIFERGFAILLSVILMAACFPLSIFAEDTTQDPDFSGTNLMNLENVQPSGYTTTTNPYGYDIGEPFLMVEQNELMYLNAWDNKVRQASYFSMGSESALNTFAKNKSGSSGTFSNPNYKLMQAVSFDPTGSGRRDHVAFVGVSGQDKKGYMWVIDTTKGTDSDLSGLVEIGDFSYMFDASAFKVPTYSNRSFLNIVAGDFDGDGKESIVVYTPESYNAGGCQIQQWDYDGDSLSRRGKSNSLLMGYYNDHPWYDVERSEGNQRRKLGVSMAVGDFNGDCVDDLAVLSYCHRLPNDEAQIDYYRPVVKIVYGTKGDTGSSIVTKSAAQSEEFYTSKGKSGGRDRYEFPVGASLTCGDFDGDGDVDLFLAGMLGKLGTWKKNNQQVNETIDMNAGYLYIGKLSNSGNGFVKTTNQTIESNGWTDGGYHDADDVWQQLAVESVAINGKGRGAKELVFLSGTLYDASNNKPVAVYTGDYFKSADDGAGSTTRISNCDIQSIAVGNFDGNTAGREQVVFTIALKHASNNKSHLLTGYMRGINYKDTTVNGEIKEYGTAGGYDCLVPTDSYVNTDAQNAVSFLVIPVDKNNDGVLAKYRGVTYAYTDPDVKAVLQAAPYFDEVMDAGNNETEYVLTESYELSDWDSDSVSFSIGYSTEFKFLGGEASIETGYALDWTKSFERSLHEEWSQSFSAQAYNSVVVSRTPVFVYEYDIQNADGTWNDKTVMQTAIPQGPVYEQLSVDAYNKFATEYNKYMADRTNKPTCYLLEKINPAANWMDGNEGDPYRYNHDGWDALNPDIQASAISKSEFALGYNGTLDKVAWTKENTTTKSVEMSHGFFFNSSIKWGDDKVGMHGVTTSLQYSDGKGNSTSKGTAVGASCTVTSLDKQSLVAEGIPAPVVDAYRFHWTLGQWQRHLSGAANNKTPFIGYSVTNLSSPPRAIDNLDKTITRGEGNFDLKLSWTKPDCENGHPEITGYYVYSKDESGAYTKVSEKLPAEATEYEIKQLDLNGKYTYVVTTVATVDNQDYESVWSNEAHYRADEAPYIGSNGNWWVGGTDTGVKAAGDDGKPGKDGETPYIGENGNWWIGFTDTKVKAAGTDGKDGEKGEDGETPYIGENGNWWIGETDTGVKAVGTDGADGTNGADGLTPSIGENGNWWIGETDTGVKAAGTDGTNGTNGADGLTPSIGENGNWWIGETDTGVKAAGTDGTNGTNGADGLTPSIGENGNWWIGETDTGVKAAGTDGTNGTNGADGLTPSIGENGNWWIGATDTGVKAAATDGADGKDGADGTNGVDGRTPQLKIGDDNLWYVSYDNGQNWESLNVKATGEMGATGAQGEKGDKGDQGEQGIQGVQGEKGDKGDQGEQGIQGVQGEKGDKGDQGAQGIQGVQGEKGDKGDQGKQGIQGVQGEKGDAGADGASGQNGTNGINGKNGVNGQDGQNGQDGKDGQDGTAGRGIDNAMIDNDGYLILTMTDGTTINAGLVRDTSAVANKEANDSATAKSLATAAVGLSGASLLWNIAMLALSITMKRKHTTFHR